MSEKETVDEPEGDSGDERLHTKVDKEFETVEKLFSTRKNMLSNSKSLLNISSQ